jgi:DNA-binding response OmpR family regulator
MRIGILEDSVGQAQAVAAWIRNAGHDTVIRHDGDSFIELIRSEPLDLLLLDWDVPGTSGIGVLQWARKTLSNTLPVIVLTHHDGEEDIVHGLNCGADDYVVKPARERELMARVNAQARKYYPGIDASEQFRVGRYTFDSEARSVQIDSENAPKKISLSAREFELALQLFHNLGRIVTKDALIRKIWGSIDRKYDATLATYVSKLRNVLELRPASGLVISTVYSFGYRLERVRGN